MAKTNNIRNKLFRRGFIVLILILLMVSASLVVVGILKYTSDEFFVEYKEMNAMQELKLSLYQLLLQTNKESFFESNPSQELFKILLHQTHEKLDECKHTITDTHDTSFLSEFYISLNKVDHLTETLLKRESVEIANNKAIIVKMINDEINFCHNQIDFVLTEIKFETSEHAVFSQTVFKHSSLTILLLGLLVILIFVIGSILFINKLTKPILELVDTTKRITKGERGIQVNIDTGDEFTALAHSFNLMLHSLESTTVSKSYLDKILKNMFDSLIVTDSSGKIRSVNRSASNLLGYSKSLLKGMSLWALFGENDKTTSNILDKNEINIQQKKIKNMSYFMHSSGKKIPALISCAVLKTDAGDSEGLIIVGHDLTKREEIEKKLEHSRKQRQIDINEAQEEERMRLATDLHDGLGQMLTAVSYSTQEFQNLDPTNTKEKERLIIKVQEQIDRAIKESKNIAHDLIPIVLGDFGLIVAIKNLIERVNEMHTIHFNFNSYDFDERIDAKLEKTLYRICQESLNNIVKHSKAKNANYQIFKQDELIVLVIDDDGIGFDLHEVEKKQIKGIGLVSMQERVQAFEGNLSIDSQIGNGTEIIIEIPYK